MIDNSEEPPMPKPRLRCTHPAVLKLVEKADALHTSFRSLTNRYGCLALKILLVIVYHVYFVCALLHDWQKARTLFVLTVLTWTAVVYFKVLKVYCHPKIGYLLSANSKQRLQLVAGKPCIRRVFLLLCAIAAAAFLLIAVAPNYRRLKPLFAIGLFISLLYSFSHHQSKINWRPVIWGFALQFLIAATFIKFKPGAEAFQWLSDQVMKFLSFTHEGSSFVYGFLAKPPPICGMPAVFIFSGLQTVIFFGACIALLYHFRVMQFVLVELAWLMQVTLGTSAIESLCAVSSMALAMTEVPLLIRPYLNRLTKSELFTVMCSGFASSSGSMFGAYVAFGACPTYVVIASVMSAPASLACTKLFYPETEESKAKSVEDLKISGEKYTNIFEAISSGASSVVLVIFYIAANLLVFIALLSFTNSILAWFGDMIGMPAFTFERIMSYVFYPVAYIMDVSDSTDPVVYAAETMTVAELMGTKIVLNEFIAYRKMGQYVAGGLLRPRAQMMASYFLCSFANFGSIGVEMAAIGSLCPEKKSTVSELALKTAVVSTVATIISTCWAGILTDIPTSCMPVSSSSSCFDVASFLARNLTAV